MYIFKKVEHLQNYLNKARNAGKEIGFVPTMGALHHGHLTLLKTAKKVNDISIASIFVNPTQFNEVSDLEKYPRTIEQDIALLHDINCDVLFLPNVDEIYPDNLDLSVAMDFGTLKNYMEGPFRPGHFEGVVQVVKRLLDIVTPTRIYMGQKDFQQWRIVERMTKQFDIPTEVIGVPIVREDNGLAMSSRNARLSQDGRVIAPNIYQTLLQAKEQLTHLPVETVKDNAIQRINAVTAFRLDYFEIVDGNTLEPIIDANEHDFVVACTAVFLEDVRLIDNMILKRGMLDLS